MKISRNLILLVVVVVITVVVLYGAFLKFGG